MVLEFVQGGDLFSHLRNVGKLSIENGKFYAANVALTIEYMHSKGIVYRDLKPENLLLAHNGYLKLADFGLAKVIENKTYTLCGTPEYLAPEMILNKGHDRAVDWWAYGVLLYEMLVGMEPFSSEDPTEVYHKILTGKLSFPKEFPRFEWM